MKSTPVERVWGAVRRLLADCGPEFRATDLFRRIKLSGAEISAALDVLVVVGAIVRLPDPPRQPMRPGRNPSPRYRVRDADALRALTVGEGRNGKSALLSQEGQSDD